MSIEFKINHVFPDIVVDPYYRTVSGFDFLYIDYATHKIETEMFDGYLSVSGANLSIYDMHYVFDRIVLLVGWLKYRPFDPNHYIVWQVGIAEFFPTSDPTKTGFYRGYTFNIPRDKWRFIPTLEGVSAVNTDQTCYKPGLLFRTGICNPTILFYEL